MSENQSSLDLHELPADARPGQSYARWIWLLVISALAIGTYIGTLDNEFVFDDRIIIVRNGKKWQDDSLWQLVRHDYWGDQRFDSLYRPVTTVSYMCNYWLSGENPAAYRIVNLVLHAACCCVLFGLTSVLFGDRRMAGAAGVLFAVHAVHVEAVAQVVGRAELLAALFSMTALWLYVIDGKRRPGRPTWRYPAAAITSALAMLSKESGTVVVAMMIAYDLWSLRFPTPRGNNPTTGADNSCAKRDTWQHDLRRLALRRWVGMLLVVLIVLTIRMEVLGQLAQDRAKIDRVDNPIAGASATERVLTPVVLLGKTLRLIVWPAPLCHDYSYNAIPICDSVLDPRFLLGLLCLATMVAGAAWSYRRSGLVLLCVGMFVLSYALISNTVVLSGTIFAERLFYVPSVAFCWLVAMGLTSIGRAASTRSAPVRVGWLAAAVLFALFCASNVYLAERRGRQWRDEPSLIAEALRLTDDSARVHVQAGLHASLADDLQTAIHHFARAVEIAPGRGAAQYQLGRCYYLTGDFAEAIPHLNKALGNVPTEANYLVAHCLAMSYHKLGMKDDARLWATRAKLLKPD